MFWTQNRKTPKENRCFDPLEGFWSIYLFAGPYIRRRSIYQVLYQDFIPGFYTRLYTRFYTRFLHQVLYQVPGSAGPGPWAGPAGLGPWYKTWYKNLV